MPSRSWPAQAGIALAGVDDRPREVVGEGGGLAALSPTVRSVTAGIVGVASRRRS